MTLKNPMQDAITATRRILTKLEFAAMDCADQNVERDLTAQLIAIQQKAESAAIAFGAT
jgi:hypothetical protein